MKMDRHHLLEIILWPNEDGTFREIRNSRARLKELGIYDDWKMCIKIPHGEHISLHQKGNGNSCFGRCGDKSPMYGKSGELSPTFGMTKERNPAWKGDMASETQKRYRDKPYRSPEAHRLRRAKRKSAAQLRAADEVRAT